MEQPSSIVFVPMCPETRRLCSALAFALLVCQVSLASPAATTDVQRLKLEAQAYEKAGDEAASLAAYERIVAAEPAAERVLADRMIQLNVDLRHPAAAVAIARRVKDQRPDPAAFFAGVLDRCGSRREARAMIENELSRESRPQRKVPLLLQLAEMSEPGTEEQAVLDRAIAAAKDTPWEASIRAIQVRKQQSAEKAHGADAQQHP